MKKVAVIMGSDSDLPVVEKAIDVLKQFEVPHEVRVLSAHRTPAEAKNFAEKAGSYSFNMPFFALNRALLGIFSIQQVACRKTYCEYACEADFCVFFATVAAGFLPTSFLLLYKVFYFCN